MSDISRSSIIQIDGRQVQWFAGALNPDGTIKRFTDVKFVDDNPLHDKPFHFGDKDESLAERGLVHLAKMMRLFVGGGHHEVRTAFVP